MNGHFVGKDNLTPDPSPKGEGSEGTSLVVLQFVALMRGEWRVQAPQSPFRVERVFAEERYCLGCCGVRWFDVVEGMGLDTAVSAQPTRPPREIAICRCCGAEVER